MASAVAVAGPGGRPALRILLYVILLIFAAFYLAPLYVMLTTSLKSLDEVRQGNMMALPHAPSLAAWVKAWSSACVGIECTGISRFFLNSVRMVIPAVAISTIIGALNGYALTKWKFKGADLIFTLILFGCFIPFQIVLIPMARVLGLLGLAASVPGLVLVHVLYGLCFTTMFLRNYYAAFPTELVKAATVDGAGFFRIFWSVMLPMATPMLVVAVILHVTGIWNDFIFGLVFAGRENLPMTVQLNNIVNSTQGEREYNVEMAATLLTAVVPLVVYFVSGRWFVRGIAAGAVKV